MAKLLNTYWTNFAKTGNPNGQVLPTWPVYAPQKNEVFEFRPDGGAGSELDQRKARLDVMEQAATHPR